MEANYHMLLIFAVPRSRMNPKYVSSVGISQIIVQSKGYFPFFINDPYQDNHVAMESHTAHGRLATSDSQMFTDLMPPSSTTSHTLANHAYFF